jgi:hypothetical protein
VVRIIKNNEMPSKPKPILILKIGSHNISQEYCNFAIELSKPIHRINEKIKVKKLENKASFLISSSFFLGRTKINKLKTINISGKNKIKLEIIILI